MILTENLVKLFEKWAGEQVVAITPLPGSGSNRKYWRIGGTSRICIGTFGQDEKENKAFVAFSEHFKQAGIAVPEIYAADLPSKIYLQEDVGDTSLFGLLMANKEEQIPEEVKKYYKLSLRELIKMQVNGSKKFDYSQCYPAQEFNRQSMRWDLNYFKYYWLRPEGVDYDEHLLEEDFRQLIEFLIQADRNYFMFRDFQARNIFIHHKKPYFIDYQGGRKGPLQYDLASLLYQAKAQLPAKFREEMLEFYLDELNEYMNYNRQEFLTHYDGFVLLRLLQVLGAYGYRGYFEQKPHFIESAAFALENLRWWTKHVTLPLDLPELYRCMELLVQKPTIDQKTELTVEINSFSYKKYGIPRDSSGHGGGFVFDCRPLPNPGRYPEYQKFTGKDAQVIEFLEKEQSVEDFFNNVYELVSQAVDNYLERKFNFLSVSFGCTGGQHRSVYFAERLNKILRSKYPIKLRLRHRMME